MNKNLLSCIFLCTLTLTACKKKEETPQPQLSCDIPQLNSEIHKNLQTIINNNARQFAQNDVRQFVDADKIIAVASELEVTLSPGQLNQDNNNKPTCNSELKIIVPPAVWQQTQNNAPLLFGKTDFIARLNQQLQNNGFTMVGNSFSKPFQYTPITPSAPASAAGTTSSIYDKTNIQNFAVTLGNALLPYGIKDTVIINGHTYNRADAITLVTNPNAKVIPIDQHNPDAQTASAILNGSTTTDTENNQNPEENNNSNKQNDIPIEVLQQVRDNNHNANSVINRQWNSLDATIRNTLQNEQQKWIVNKTKYCQAQINKASTPTQAEYLRLQCDTKMTNDRIKYLNGYTLH